MPNACCVPGCRGNYKNGPKVQVFKFPAEKSLNEKWLRAIRREGFTPSKNSKVCELHFLPHDFQTVATGFDEASGKKITVPLQVRRLVKNAVPSQLPNCPAYLSSSHQHRESPDARREVREQQAISKALEESVADQKKYENDRTFHTLSELYCRKKFLTDLNFWTIVQKEDRILILNLIYDPSPRVRCSLVINSNLETTAYVENVELRTLHGTKLPSKVSCINNINDMLEEIKNMATNEKPIDYTIAISYIQQFVAAIASTNANENVLQFIEEQLVLACKNKHSFHYSPQMLVFASILYSMAPHAYRFILKSGHIILPHPSTIRRICNTFNANPQLEQSEKNFLLYARNKFPSLQPCDTTLVLMVDEIHLKPFLDYKGGNIAGFSFNKQDVASSAHVFMVAGVTSSYKDVVHILPAKTISAEVLHAILKKVICGLESIGFKVICVVTDNNSINRKCMSLFVTPPSTQIVYPHPADITRPLFFLIDTVHILKSIRNNWINQKNHDKCMFYPPFEETGDITFKTACFETLKKLHNIEFDSLVKFGYNLSLKALSPSNIERQNVKLVLQVFNRFVAEGLMALGTKYDLPHVEDTADFIKIVCIWWDIVNVKFPHKGIRLNNIYQNPLTISPTDERAIFLNRFLDWLERWEKMNCDTGVFSKETLIALKLTTHCLLELSSYCAEELKLPYILTGKFQTDSLESRFSQYRQIAGSQYHISLRQLFEGEKKLRVRSLLKFSSKPGKIFQLDEFDFDEDFGDLGKIKNFVHFPISVTPNDMDSLTDFMPVLAYLSGYCAFAVLKKLKCDFCKSMLVSDKELELDCSYDLIKKLDRGKLQCPTEKVINAVAYNYIVVKKLCSDFECEFFNLSNHKYVATSLTTFVLERDEEYVDRDICENAHFVENVFEMIIWSSTNIFLNNYCKKRNDELQYSNAKKRKLKKFQTK